jgi:hypothetical protein
MIKICDSFASTSRNLGNKLFTYALARILSEELSLNVILPKDCFVQRCGVVENFPFYSVNNKNDITNPILYVHDLYLYNIGLTNFINNSKNYGILLDGYFLRYDYIKPYKNFIRSLYNILTKDLKYNEDIIIMLRDSNADSTFCLPETYYLKILSEINFKTLYISFDHYNKHKNLIEKLQKKYNTILLDLNIIELMKEITSFKTIIACQGTFSFWASFLSNAQTIYWPITTIGPNKNSDIHVNLTVDDESRYKFINI